MEGNTESKPFIDYNDREEEVIPMNGVSQKSSVSKRLQTTIEDINPLLDQSMKSSNKQEEGESSANSNLNLNLPDEQNPSNSDLNVNIPQSNPQADVKHISPFPC